MAEKRSNERAAKVQRILQILHKWGVHTLGQLADLNKDEISARLGSEAVRMWEQANGKSRRLLRLTHLPESFRESFEFEYEIETAEPLLFMLRRFLDQLALRLGAIYLVSKELVLRITFGNNTTYERIFQLPQPTNDVDLLFRMLQTHLENFKSEHPIVAISLEAQPAKPPRQQFGLFETALRNPLQLAETLARLSGLLGSARVGRPVLEETHRPDAFRMEPFEWAVESAVPSGERPSYALRRAHATAALRRFRPALPASLFSSENRHLHSETISGKILDQRGPYLLSGNWWDEKSWQRAEWDVQLEEDILCRSYQSDDGPWAINGIYD